MNNKTQYSTPVVKVVAFKVEEGFQSLEGASGFRLSTDTPPENYNNNNMQGWSTDNGSLFDTW